MDIQTFKKELQKFNIEEEKINSIIKNKNILKLNQNYFLIDKNQTIKNNQTYTNNIIYIQLRKLLPSKFLLNLIDKTTQNKIEIKNEKQALNFTYGKDLHTDSIKEITLQNNQYYIVKYNKNILGYAKFDKTKKHQIINKLNIGEYLKEN